MLLYRCATSFRNDQRLPVLHQLLAALIDLVFIIAIVVRASKFNNLANLGILHIW